MAPDNKQNNKQSNKQPSEEQQLSNNKQVARRYLEECWNQGKLDSVRELVADNYRHHDPVFPSLNGGVDNIRQHIATCRSAFPDLKFTIDDTIAERNEVVHHWTGRGTHRGQFLGIHGTNKHATVSGTSIFRIEHGKIVEQWVDWNLMTMMEQLGVAAPARAEAKQHA